MSASVLTPYPKWLWVRKSAPSKKDGNAEAATEEAEELCQWYDVSFCEIVAKRLSRSGRNDQTSGTDPGWYENVGDGLTQADRVVFRAMTQFPSVRTRKRESRARRSSVKRSVAVTEPLVPMVIFSQVQREATEKLKEVSTKHGFVSGKWYVNMFLTQSCMSEICIEPIAQAHVRPC